MHLALFVLFSTLLCQSSFSADQDFNPYEVLGIPRTASEKDIRQAYKKLARHWHPDKNSEPNAHEQFTKINAAYEVKRNDGEEFDVRTVLSRSSPIRPNVKIMTNTEQHLKTINVVSIRTIFVIRSTSFEPISAEIFISFAKHRPVRGKSFMFGTDRIIFVNSERHDWFSSREFLSDILPNSDRKPYLLFGSTNFCFQCRQALATFRSLESQLNDVGIGTAEFNVNDQRLSNELGILNAPSLCVVSQRRVYHFDDQGKISSYSESNIKEFLRKSIPIHRYIQTVRRNGENTWTFPLFSWTISMIWTESSPQAIKRIVFTRFSSLDKKCQR